ELKLPHLPRSQWQRPASLRRSRCCCCCCCSCWSSPRSARRSIARPPALRRPWAMELWGVLPAPARLLWLPSCPSLLCSRAECVLFPLDCRRVDL
ncbi:unnamed protein product, partial [Musa acuminata var. zebrina]